MCGGPNRGSDMGTTLEMRIQDSLAWFVYAYFRMNQAIAETSIQDPVAAAITRVGREFDRNLASSNAKSIRRMPRFQTERMFFRPVARLLLFLSTAKHLRASGMHCISAVSPTQDNSLSDQLLSGERSTRDPVT
jgi:hypothetical protein